MPASRRGTWTAWDPCWQTRSERPQGTWLDDQRRRPIAVARTKQPARLTTEKPLMPFPKGFDIDFFLRELDKKPELVGCRVVYFDDAVMTTLRVGPLMSSEDLIAVVVRKGGSDLLPTNAEVQRVKDQRFHAELLNLGLSCGGLVLSWVGTAVSTGAAPLTGGLSLLITAVTTTATVASYGQCAVAIVRTGAEFVQPEFNVDMDNSELYQTLSTAADIVGLASVATTSASTLRAIHLLKKTTGKSMLDIVRGLSRQERKRLTEELLRSQNPGISNAKMKLMRLANAKDFPKRFSNGAITAGMRKQLLEVLGSMGNVTGSATSGVIAQSASGGPDDGYIVGIARAYETQ